MKKPIFKGVATALITPFCDGKIDVPALEGLIENQIAAGVGALVIGGTTGEAATLDCEERYELFRESKRIVDGRAQLIFGTGTNDTRLAVRHTKEAQSIGCDGVLIVTPYYNKGTRDGLVRHYEAILEASSLPIILYNVPSRTGVNLDVGLVTELAHHSRVLGIKEASGSLDRLTELSLIDGLPLYAGNDAETHTVLSLGGVGVISVVSNLYPKSMVELCNHFFTGEREKSLKIQKKLLPVINSLFLETNPAPIKYAMAKRGMCLTDMRLPMWLPTESTRRKIDEATAAFEREK